MDEPFYLFIGIISAFALGVVVFFSTRKDVHTHELPPKKKSHHRTA